MKKRIKRIIAWTLILCMSTPTMISAQAETGADVVGEVIPMDRFVVQHHSAIDSYRQGEFIAPDEPLEYSDYLFAGWYHEEECKTALQETDKTGPAYAKFVHKDVLGVKAQLESGTYFNTEEADVRFVSTVDSLAYQKVGFNFVVYGKETPYECKEVYSKLFVMNSGGVVMDEYTPDSEFHDTSRYFFACKVAGVKNASFDCRIQATPYWVTLDGTMVEAESVTKSISDGYMDKLTDADAVPEGIINPEETYSLQGGAIGGKYYYLVSSITTTDDVSNTGTENTMIYRLTRNAEDTEWNAIVNKEERHLISEVKDIAYNSTAGLLVMVSGDSTNEVSKAKVTLINRSSLVTTTSESITTVEIPLAVESMKYNDYYNQYVVMLADESVKILNADFTETSVAVTRPVNLVDYTAQSVTADDSYLYQAFSKVENEGTTNESVSNMIAVYDWEGNHVTTIEVAFQSYVVRTIDISKNIIYAACDTGTKINMYNIDIKKIFDIIYKLDGGTTTNPTTYTVNSDSITLDEPTKQGYDFLGWSEESASLSEVTWNDGFVDDLDGKTPYNPEDTSKQIPTEWDDAVYSNPISLKLGMKHTIVGTDLPEHRWRLFETDELTNGETRKEESVTVTKSPYAVLVFRKALSEAQKKTLKIYSEPTNQPTLSYTDGEMTSTIALKHWTKGFIEKDVAWKVTYAHADYPNAVYSDEIELKAGVTYTLSGNIGSVRWRLIPDDSTGIVTNHSSATTCKPGKDCKVRILLLSGYSQNTDVTIATGSTGDRSYTASWIRNSFQVKYDPNGGLGAVKDSIHEFGQAGTLEANTYTKTGYTFVGWNTQPDGSGSSYADMASISDPMMDGDTFIEWSKEESITLYAQWDIKTYTITYDYKNNGYDTPENPAEYSIVTDTFTLNRPTRPGYTFKGWKETIYIKPWYNGFLDLNDGQLVENSRYTESVYSERIYLQGDRNKTRIYTLQVPGLKEEDKSTIRARMYYDTGAVNNILTGNYEHKPVWNGYVSYMFYLGCFDADMENISVISDTSVEKKLNDLAKIDISIVKGSTGDRHYEAVWEANNYTVRYDANDGEGTMENSEYVYGVQKKLSKNTFTKIVDGVECVFIGWNTMPDGSGTTYVDEATLENLATEADGVVTLYAQWATTDIYTIAYNLGDGASLAEGESNPTRYAKTSESFTLKKPTREGYVFKGWRETITLEGLSLDSENSSWIPGFVNETTGAIETDNTTYPNALYTDYIYLQKGRTYTLSANANTATDGQGTGIRWRLYDLEGTHKFNRIETEVYINDSSYYVRILLPWGFADGADTSATITSEATSITIDKGTTGNRTYTAIWERITTQ